MSKVFVALVLFAVVGSAVAVSPLRRRPHSPPVGAAAPATSSYTCLANYNGKAVATRAVQYQQTYQKDHVVYNQAKRQFGLAAKFSDCSSFVNSILADTGFDCAFALPTEKNTAYMNSVIAKRGSYKQTAIPGDLIMWGGHTGIVTEACGNNLYSMVAMGLHGAGSAKCLTTKALAGWGSGGSSAFGRRTNRRQRKHTADRATATTRIPARMRVTVWPLQRVDRVPHSPTSPPPPRPRSPAAASSPSRYHIHSHSAVIAHATASTRPRVGVTL